MLGNTEYRLTPISFLPSSLYFTLWLTRREQRQNNEKRAAGAWNLWWTLPHWACPSALSQTESGGSLASGDTNCTSLSLNSVCSSADRGEKENEQKLTEVLELYPSNFARYRCHIYATLKVKLHLALQLWSLFGMLGFQSLWESRVQRRHGCFPSRFFIFPLKWVINQQLCSSFSYILPFIHKHSQFLSRWIEFLFML